MRPVHWDTLLATRYIKLRGGKRIDRPDSFLAHAFADGYARSLCGQVATAARCYADSIGKTPRCGKCDHILNKPTTEDDH